MAQMSNSETPRQKAATPGENSDFLDREDLPTANIVVAGITGTGKSTLINAIFGSELAKTGVGRPITDHINDYHNPDVPVRIWDTVGFELDSEKTKKAIEDIRRTIAGKAQSKEQFDRIHAIWYCLQEGANRYQDAETDFVRTLHKLDVPFIIVVTKSITDDEYVKVVKDINKSQNLGDIEVIPVLAQDYKTKLGTIEAFGLDTLVKVTLEKLPEFIKSGLIAAQKVDVVLKRTECEKIIIEFSRAAHNGRWDNVPFVNLFTTDKKILNMFDQIGRLYNMVLSPEAIAQLTTRLGADWNNSKWALINPFKFEYAEKFENLLRKMSKTDGREMSKTDGLNIKPEEFRDRNRSAQMIIVFGYIFMVASEEVWKTATEDTLKNMQLLVQKIAEQIKEFLRKNEPRRKNNDLYNVKERRHG